MCGARHRTLATATAEDALVFVVLLYCIVSWYDAEVTHKRDWPQHCGRRWMMIIRHDEISEIPGRRLDYWNWIGTVLV